MVANKGVEVPCFGADLVVRSKVKNVKIKKRHGKYKFSASQDDINQVGTDVSGTVKKHGKIVKGQVTLEKADGYCRGGGKFEASH